MLKYILIVVVIILIGIQFIPVERTNPPVTSEITAPPEVKKILKESCYDCHSNETEWPWYSYVAPVSFFVANDVNHGREHFNLSEWNIIKPEDRVKVKEEMWEEVEEGEMPLSSYEIMHPDAELTKREKKILKDWSEGK